MLDFTKLPDLLNPFGWLSRLGKGDADHIKGEIADLLQHSSQSLRTLIELADTFVEIPLKEFTAASFWPLANHCFLVFTSPEAIQKARTHCTDIHRDVIRINFKMAKILRAERLDWKGIDAAFADLLNADSDFLASYDKELTRLDEELRAIGNLLTSDQTQTAWERYTDLRRSVQTSRQALSSQIASMQKAQDNVHSLLT